MDLLIESDGNDIYLVRCPQEMEWQVRMDLVDTVTRATDGRIFRGLILDLVNVTFINSAGLGAIFTLRKYAEQAGAEMIVARPRVNIQRMLATAGLPKLMFVASSLSEARTKLKSSTARVV